MNDHVPVNIIDQVRGITGRGSGRLSFLWFFDKPSLLVDGGSTQHLAFSVGYLEDKIGVKCF